MLSATPAGDLLTGIVGYSLVLHASTKSASEPADIGEP